MRIQIFVFLVTLVPNLNFRHATNRGYLQRPLKPDPAPLYCMADSADYHRNAVILLQALCNPGELQA